MSMAAPGMHTVDAASSNPKASNASGSHRRSAAFADVLNSAQPKQAPPAKPAVTANTTGATPAEPAKSGAPAQSHPAGKTAAKTAATSAAKESTATKPIHTAAPTKAATAEAGEKSSTDGQTTETAISLASLQMPTLAQAAMRAMMGGSAAALEDNAVSGAGASSEEPQGFDDEDQPADPAAASVASNALPASLVFATAVENRAEFAPAASTLSVSAPAQASGSHTAGTPLLPGLAATANAGTSDVGQPPAGQAIPLPQAATPALPSQQVAVALLRNLSGEASQGFTMQLRPDHLGSVAVHLEIDAKGHATANFVADHPEALHLLKQDASHLVRALNEAGVNADASALSFSLRDTGSGDSDGSRDAFPPGRQRSTGESSDGAAAIEITTAWRPTASNRLYDIHA